MMQGAMYNNITVDAVLISESMQNNLWTFIMQYMT
jgi:hypothetical protein